MARCLVVLRVRAAVLLNGLERVDDDDLEWGIDFSSGRSTQCRSSSESRTLSRWFMVDLGRKQGDARCLPHVELEGKGKLIEPRDRYRPIKAAGRHCIAHMESSLVEFTLDNRSIDEVRAGSHTARAFSLTPPTVPAIRGEWRGVPVLLVGIGGKILEDIFSCMSHHVIVTVLSLLIASQDDIKTAQKDLEASLLDVISPREPYPVPGRALRNLVASSILILYTRGDSKNMFDTLIAYLKIASAFKAPADRDQHKMYVLISSLQQLR